MTGYVLFMIPPKSSFSCLQICISFYCFLQTFGDDAAGTSANSYNHHSKHSSNKGISRSVSLVLLGLNAPAPYSPDWHAQQ